MAWSWGHSQSLSQTSPLCVCWCPKEMEQELLYQCLLLLDSSIHAQHTWALNRLSACVCVSRGFEVADKYILLYFHLSPASNPPGLFLSQVFMQKKRIFSVFLVFWGEEYAWTSLYSAVFVLPPRKIIKPAVNSKLLTLQRNVCFPLLQIFEIINPSRFIYLCFSFPMPTFIEDNEDNQLLFL